MGKERVMKCPYKKKVTKCVTNERYTNIAKTYVVVDFTECSKFECPFYQEQEVYKHDGNYYLKATCKRAEREVK